MTLQVGIDCPSFSETNIEHAGVRPSNEIRGELSDMEDNDFGDFDEDDFDDDFDDDFEEELEDEYEVDNDEFPAEQFKDAGGDEDEFDEEGFESTDEEGGDEEEEIAEEDAGA